MATNFDYAVALAVAILVGYFGLKFFTGEEKEEESFSAFGTANNGDDRNIVAKMAAQNKNVVVFYGSQTGTAEDCASKLAKDLSVRFGFKTMTADLENYDFESLADFDGEHMAFFCLASYGEGEPTDNAVDFWQWLTDEDFEGDLSSLNYCVFGLGNSTYDMFNEVGRVANKLLEKHGAQRVAEYGEGDDGKDSMEDDFVAWKEQLFATLKARGLEEKEYEYEPSLKLEPVAAAAGESAEAGDSKSTGSGSAGSSDALASSGIFLGEANANILAGKYRAPFHQTNPHLAKVSSTTELFNSTSRSCIKCEFDIAGSGLRYTTGDHLAFWPQNSDAEVDRFLKALGLSSKRSQAITIKALDPTAKVPFPVPTTYDTIVRYWLEINGPVSRQVLGNLSGFAPDGVKKEVVALSKDKALFHEKVSKPGYNLAGLLLKLSGGKPWDVPFTFIVENIPHLQVRYYSISSSSAETKDTIGITAVVERENRGDNELRGVATNYISNLLHPQHLEYQLAGPRGIFKSEGGYKVPVHVRRSNFKLPSKLSVPIIMVGPGTGVAPFRGFIRERATLAKERDQEPGKALLFFGCRHAKEDALYADEWPAYSDKSTVGSVDGPFTASNFLEVQNAFSRDGQAKVYVQHRMAENSALISELLAKGAYFYVCGDASNMARSVHAALVEILSKERGVSKGEAEEIVKKMKNRNLYQEDIW